MVVGGAGLADPVDGPAAVGGADGRQLGNRQHASSGGAVSFTSCGCSIVRKPISMLGKRIRVLVNHGRDRHHWIQEAWAGRACGFHQGKQATRQSRWPSNVIRLRF